MISISSTMPTMAASTGTILQPRRHARRAAAHDQHRLAEAGVDGVDRNHVITFRFAFGIHGPRNQELAADQARIFAGRHDGADHFGQYHYVIRVGPHSSAAVADAPDLEVLAFCSVIGLAI